MIRPINKKIFVEPETEIRVLASEPIKKCYGKVTAIGDEVNKIKVGDRIAYVAANYGLQSIQTSEDEFIYYISEDSPWLIGVDDGTN